MQSRMEKYYKQDLSEFKRTNKNASLYKEVYGEYSNLDNLPIPDNTNEIDITKLKQIIESRDDYHKAKEAHESNVGTSDSTKINYDSLKEEDEIRKQEQKIYDINKLLEKAKNDNKKLKEASQKLIDTNYNFLSTLQDSELSISEIEKAKEALENKQNVNKIDERKYQTKRVLDDPTVDQLIPTNSSPLDLLSDLKPTEDTIVTQPINQDDAIKKEDVPVLDPIGKKDEVKESEESFYSGSYKFSKKDFDGGMSDEFLPEKRNHYFLKIMFLLFGIAICGTIIYFFIRYYGIGA